MRRNTKVFGSYHRFYPSQDLALEGLVPRLRANRSPNSISRVFSGCSVKPIQEEITKRCRAPIGAFDNQPMPPRFAIPNAPTTARNVSCFTSFKKDSKMLDVVRKCGIPDRHAGSGIYIFVYYVSDCSTVAVSTPDLKRIGIGHVKHGKTWNGPLPSNVA